MLIAFGCLCIDTTVPEVINFMVVEYLDSALYCKSSAPCLSVRGLYQGLWSSGRRAEPRFVPFEYAARARHDGHLYLGVRHGGSYVSTFVFLFGYCCSSSRRTNGTS